MGKYYGRVECGRGRGCSGSSTQGVRRKVPTRVHIRFLYAFFYNVPKICAGHRDRDEIGRAED